MFRYHHSKTCIYLFFILLISSLAYAETSSSSINWASFRYVNANFCALNAPSCVFLGNMTFMGEVFNLSVTNIYINSTTIIGLNETIIALRYWNRTGTTLTPANAGDNLDMGAGDIDVTILNADTSITTPTISSGSLEITFSGGGLLQSGGDTSINWPSRQLIDVSGSDISLNWADRELIANDSSDVILDWATPGIADFKNTNIVTSTTLEADMILDTDSVVAIDNDERWLKASDGDVILDWSTPGLANFWDSDIQIDSDTSGLILGDAQDKKIFANGSGMYFTTLVGDTPFVIDGDITGDNLTLTGNIDLTGSSPSNLISLPASGEITAPTVSNRIVFGGANGDRTMSFFVWPSTFDDDIDATFFQTGIPGLAFSANNGAELARVLFRVGDSANDGVLITDEGVSDAFAPRAMFEVRGDAIINESLGVGVVPVEKLHIEGVATNGDFYGQKIRETGGTSEMYMGSFRDGGGTFSVPSIWLSTSTITPSATNFAFQGSNSASAFNAPSGGQMYFRIGNANKWSVLPDGDFASGVDGTAVENIITAGNINATDGNFAGNVDVAKNFTGNQIRGEMYNRSPSASPYTFTIAATNIYYNLTGLVLNGGLNGFTFTDETQANGGSYLTAQVSGQYDATASLCTVIGAASGDLYGYAISHEFERENHENCYSRRTAVNKVGCVPISCLIDIEAGTKVNIQIEQETGGIARDVGIHTVNLKLIRVGDIP